jgi:hypothetical protein
MTATGFYPQPNDWLCGPFALKHALWLLGIQADERRIAKDAGTDRTGTDEAELARAAEKHECDLLTVRLRDPESASRELDAYLAQRTPVLLCIEQWDHWVVAAHEDDGLFVVVDSRVPALFRLLPWELLQDLLVYREGRGTRRIYDLHPLMPRNRASLTPTLTLDRARFLREWENLHVVREWHAFLADVLEAFGRHTDGEGLSPGLFFGRHEPALLDAVAASNDAPKRSEARRVLRALRFLADTYGITAPAQGSEAVIERLTAVLRRRLSGTGAGARG